MKFEDLHSPLAEAGVIATLVHRADFVFFCEELTPRDFFSNENACLFWAIRSLTEDGVFEIDNFSLMSKLSSNSAVEQKMNKANINTINDILELSQYSCNNTEEGFKALVKDVMDFSARRKIYLDAQKLSNLCLSDGCNSEMLQKRTYEISEEANLLHSKRKEIKLFSDKTNLLWKEIQDRQNGNLKTFKTPFPSLNKYAELESGEMLLIGASAKTGKSACLLTMAVDLLRQGNCILLIDSELSDRLYLLRMVAHISGIDFAIVKSGKYSDEQKVKIQSALEEIKTFKFYHEYTPVFSDNELMTIFKRVNTVNKVDVIIVDYFKISTFSDAFATSAQLAKSVDIVKNEIAGAYDIPCLAAIQLTNTGQVALSAAVVRNCSTLVSITRKTQEEINNDGGLEFGNSKFFVGINRNGEQMAEGEYISVDFVGNTLTYKEVKKQPEKKEPY